MTPPSPEALVGWVLAGTVAALLAVGAATQSGAPVRPCNTIEGLVLDGGRVTTTAQVSSANDGRPYGSRGAASVTRPRQQRRHAGEALHPDRRPPDPLTGRERALAGG